MNISRLVIHVYSCIYEYFRFFSHIFVTEISIRRQSNFGLAARPRCESRGVINDWWDSFSARGMILIKGFGQFFITLELKCSRTYQHEHFSDTNILDLNFNLENDLTRAPL